ncbi:MAG: hypothetical protein QOF46_2111 [Paraburkholderia sp.]|nr:hypothetical protein [Paraburkholderia sp.]
MKREIWITFYAGDCHSSTLKLTRRIKASLPDGSHPENHFHEPRPCADPVRNTAYALQSVCPSRRQTSRNPQRLYETVNRKAAGIFKRCSADFFRTAMRPGAVRSFDGERLTGDPRRSRANERGADEGLAVARARERTCGERIVFSVRIALCFSHPTREADTVTAAVCGHVPLRSQPFELAFRTENEVD